MDDIRGEVPTQVVNSLLEEERIYYFGSAKSCLGGSKTFIAITDQRVFGMAEQPGGCLGRKNLATVDIPLEHVSSVRTASGGCLLAPRTGQVIVSSGTANNPFRVGSTDSAQRAVSVLQQAMREARKRA